LGNIYGAGRIISMLLRRYKSVAENAIDASLKLIAQEKLKAITESTNTVK
jgi:hypothetical protein